MRGSKTKAQEEAKASESAGEWQGLVRKLVLRLGQSVNRDQAHLQEGHAEEEVLFDGQVDGVRCLLLRSRTPMAPPVILSPREREIARMVAKGLPNKTIAGVLEISGWTVCSHLRRIFSKLGVNSRAAMVARVLGTHQLDDPALERRRVDPCRTLREGERKVPHLGRAFATEPGI
jgi:two-component system nitrate/nitrite response regulator NarL